MTKKSISQLPDSGPDLPRVAAMVLNNPPRFNKAALTFSLSNPLLVI
jgi:hypothetical protein